MIIIVIILLMNFLAPKDLYLKFNPMIEEYNIAKERYEKMSYNIIMKETILSRNKELANEISNINIDTDILQEEIMSFLYSSSKKNNVEIEKIILSEQASVINDDSGEVSVSVKKTETAVEFIKISMNFKCSFDNMLKFIDDIRNDNKYIEITHFYLLSWSDEAVNCAVDLCFYTIPINDRW